MSEAFDAVVIGSGLGGLTAGALYSHAGYRVLVLERNQGFGGAATTYHRGRMTIEASLHETTDPRQVSDLKAEVFDALGLYDDIEFVPVGDFYEVRGPLVGKPLVVPHGLDAAKAGLTERFPGDAKAIDGFFDRVDKIQTAANLFTEKHSGRWWLSHVADLPLALWPVVRDLRATVSEVLDRTFGTNEALKVAVAANLMYYADDPDTMWWLSFVVAQGGYLAGGGNYLKGGSQTLSDRLVDRITTAGGDARTGCDVTDVVLDATGHIAGVRYQHDGDTVTVDAPVVFANAAPHAVGRMLPDDHQAPFMTPYADKPVSISLFSINLGLNRPPSELGVAAYSTVLLPNWLTELRDFKGCAALLGADPGERLPVLAVCDHHHIDSGLHNHGDLYTLNIVGVDRLANWEHLDPTAYQSRRDAWLDAIIAAVDVEWPGLTASIEESDMATARTMHEYLNTPGGAVYGFAPHAPDGMPRGGPLGSPTTTVPGLWLASAYSGMGGFTGAMGGGTAAAHAAIKALHN